MNELFSVKDKVVVITGGAKDRIEKSIVGV